MLHVSAIFSRTMGHRSHALSLQRRLPASDCEVEFRWLDEEVDFRTHCLGKLVSTRMPTAAIRRRNVDFRRLRVELGLSIHGRNLIRASRCSARDTVLFCHTQVPALTAASWLTSGPSVISTDMVASQVTDAFLDGWAWTLRPNVWVERRAFRAATMAVFWSKWAAEAAIRGYGLDPRRVEVIPPGVDIDAIQPDLVPRNNHAKVRLLFVGEAFHRKGGSDLLQAYQNRLSHLAELDIVSNDPAVAEASGIRVHRSVTPYSETWFRLFREADIFVLPTRREAFGIAFIEAMAAGLPVVGTRVNAVPEIVHEGVSGLLVPARDPRSLAGSLTTLIESPALRRQMGQAGRQIAEQQFDEGANAARLRQVLVAAKERFADPVWAATAM